MPEKHISPHDSESGGARAGGHTPPGEQAIDWAVWDKLLTGSEPAPTLVKRIPNDQHSVYFTALVDALPPGATYIRHMRNGELWRGRYTHEQRLCAIRLLGALRDRRATGPLVRQLSGPSNHVRIALIMALGWISGPAAVTALTDILKHPHEATRIEAARWLGWMADAEARQPLADALSDPADNVRYAAAKSLAQLGDARAYGPLFEAFWHGNGVERDQILQALNRFDPQRTVQALVQARGQVDSARYKAATRALQRLGTAEALAALEPYAHRLTGDFDDAK